MPVTKYRLRRQWRKRLGPGLLDMPDDGPGTPLVLVPPWPVQHEDFEDSVNEDGTVGPINPGTGGGSSIVMGYATGDFSNVVLLDDGAYAREVWFNWEHWIRQIRYTIVRCAMSLDLSGPRRIVQYANHAKEYWDAPTIEDDPGFTPDNINQYLHMALMNPHTGSPVNCRALGWVLYGEVMACLVNPNRDRTFLIKVLDFLDLAAIPGSGQVGCGPNTGGGPLDQLNVQYGFHAGILIHAALCGVQLLGRAVPQWVIDNMNGMDALPSMDYYGRPAMMAFSYTVNGVLTPATGEGQHGDPACSFWSPNCVLLKQITGDQSWLDRAPRWGPTTWDPSSTNATLDRYYSMPYRGATSTPPAGRARQQPSPA